MKAHEMSDMQYLRELAKCYTNSHVKELLDHGARLNSIADRLVREGQEQEDLKGRVSRIGLDIDKALRGEVVETSPVAGRLARITALANAAPQAPAAAAAPTDAMVDAYLLAQRRAVEEADQLGRPNIGGLHTNTVREACRAGLAAALDAAPAAQEAEPVPIDMVLHCPACGMQHIDAPEMLPMAYAIGAAHFSPGYEPWENPPHRSHLCHGCRHIWRPADVPTNGVAAVQTKGKADSPAVSKSAPSPAAEVLQDGCAEHQTVIEAFEYLPAGTKLYTK